MATQLPPLLVFIYTYPLQCAVYSAALHSKEWTDLDVWGGWHGVRATPGKSQVAIGFIRKSGTDHPGEAIVPFACRGRSVCHSVKYVDNKNTLPGPPQTKVSGSAHERRHSHHKLQGFGGGGGGGAGVRFAHLFRFS